MGLLSGIYDSAPIQPVAKIKENLAVWSRGSWHHFNIDLIEPIPRSSPTMVEMVTASGAVTIAANGTIAKRVVTFLRVGELELLHLRWEPLDDVEGVLWELPTTARFSTGFVHARVTPFTALRDPDLATTTFFVLGGKERNMNLEVRNPTGVALPQARFVFFGYRYLLTILDKEPSVTTWLPAEGR